MMITGNHPRVAGINEINQLSNETQNIIRDHLEIHQTIIDKLKKSGSMAI